MRVLLVEDDATTSASIELMLRKESFICDTTDLGEDGLEIGKLYDYDIIILDLLLPDMDGYEVLRRLRAARVRTPILILSGLGELDHKIKGLGFGADDFLTKPFEQRELIARIQAIVRRSKGHPESTIRTGKLLVNLDSRIVNVGDQPLHLTAKEYGILELLSLRKGTTLTKEMFLNHLYGGVDDDPAAEPRRQQTRKIGARRPRAQLLDRHRERQCRPDRFARASPLALAVELRRAAFDIEDQSTAARQRLAADRRHVAAEFLPFDGQPTDRFAVIAGDRAFLEQRAHQPVGRQARQFAACEAIGKPIELQPPIGLAGALADQRNGVLDEIRLLVGEQFGAVADRSDRPDQLMAEARCQQFEDAQIDRMAHPGMLA